MGESELSSCYSVESLMHPGAFYTAASWEYGLASSPDGSPTQKSSACCFCLAVVPLEGVQCVFVRVWGSVSQWVRSLNF